MVSLLVTLPLSTVKQMFFQPGNLLCLCSRANLFPSFLNHEYACTYLDVDKAWKELQKLSSLKCEELPEMSLDSDSYDYDDEEVYEEYEAATGYQAFDGIYDYRHIRDISNVIKYDTLTEPLNGVIHQYILDAGLDCEVMAGAMFPTMETLDLEKIVQCVKEGCRLTEILSKN